MSTPKSSTRRRISLAGLYDAGTLVQPVASVGAAPAKGAWPAKPAGWSNWSPKLATKAALSAARRVVGRHAAPGEEALEVDRGAVDGGVAAAGPLDLGDLEAAALRALGDGLGLEDVGVERGRPVARTAAPLMWNVLLVEPWTPGQAPVARLYQPAPVLGGASVSRPLPAAFVPPLRNEAIVGRRPCAAYLATRSWRRPSAAKKTALSSSEVGPPEPCGPDAAAGTARAEPTRARMAGSSRSRRRWEADVTKHLSTNGGHAGRWWATVGTPARGAPHGPEGRGGTRGH